ncbi:MAG: hypothetical protein XD98_0518, partial [Microgenomates bacterium 39_6]
NQIHNQSPKKQSNFFEDNAGPEELAHLQDLIDKLTDKELANLAKKVGIKFYPPPGKTTPRLDYEMVIVESDREDFYREYRKIMETRRKIQKNNLPGKTII